MKEIIKTEKAPILNLPLSPAVKKGNFIFISGQVGVDPKSGKAVEGFEAQTRRTLDNVFALLEAAGGKKEDIVKVVGYLSDVNNFSLFNEIYREYFDDAPPARTCFGVGALVDPYIVEVEAIAILDE